LVPLYDRLGLRMLKLLRHGIHGIHRFARKQTREEI